MATEKKQSLLAQVEETLELYLYKKAPAVPENVREILVKVAPWVNVIGIVMGLLALPAIFALFGIGAALAPFAALGGASTIHLGTTLVISTLLLVPVLVLQIMAAKGLFNQEAKAWKLMFYAELLSAVSSLIGFSITGVLWSLVFIYLLFQIRSEYK